MVVMLCTQFFFRHETCSTLITFGPRFPHSLLKHHMQLKDCWCLRLTCNKIILTNSVCRHKYATQIIGNMTSVVRTTSFQTSSPFFFGPRFPHSLLRRHSGLLKHHMQLKDCWCLRLKLLRRR